MPCEREAPEAFAGSYLFDALASRDVLIERDAARISLANIAEYVALHHKGFEQINEAALNRALVSNFASI